METPPTPPAAPAIRRRRAFILTASAASTILALLAVELGLRLLESSHRARPNAAGDYGEAVRTIEEGFIAGGGLDPNFDALLQDGYGGTFRMRTNSAGFRNDREFAEAKPEGVLRIHSLGDSFAVGYRVAQEKIYSRLLEDWLRAQGGWRDVEVMVSLTHEPVCALYYLQTLGHRYRPDLILCGLTLGNDISQAYVSLDPKGLFDYAVESGGLDLRSMKKPGIWWDSGLEAYDLPAAALDDAGPAPAAPAAPAMLQRSRLYARLRDAFAGERRWDAPETLAPFYPGARTPKVFDCSHGLAYFLKDPTPEVETAYRRLYLALAGLKAHGDREGASFLLMLFPQRFQVQPGDWEATVRAYRLRREHFDLMRPNRLIRAHCESIGLPCIDLTEGMAAIHRRDGHSLYLPLGDMHWNERGHRALFETVRGEVKKAGEGGRDKDSR